MLWLRIKRKIRMFANIIMNPVNKFCLSINGVQFESDVNVIGKIWIYNEGTIKLGHNVKIRSAEWSNPIGGGTKTQFQVMRSGYLEIGDYTGLSNVAITCVESIMFGSNVLIGAGSKIYDTDFHPLNPTFRYGEASDIEQTKHKAIVVEDGVFIGANVTILKGTYIGKNSIIGAGSVVTGKIPANEIWGGNPAKYIKQVPKV